MRRLWLFTCLAGALGCQCGDPDEALKVVVKIDPAQKATCAVLEISDGSGVRFTQELVRTAGRDELVVGLKQGDLPRTIGLKARGFISGAGCDSPRTFNGDSGDLSATFPDKGVQTVEVPLPPPPAANDVDRDGYVARAFGGMDCDDNDSAVRPGVPQICGSSTDQDCDDAVGCADTECSPTAFCQRTPDRLVFVTAPVTVDARACSPALTVETQDGQGVVPARQGLPVALAASPSTGVTFYSDAACSTPATTVTILQGETRGTFYFRATQGGTTFTATASLIGLTPASQLETVAHPVPTQLGFTTPPRTAAANACSAALTVELRDSSGTATQVGGPVLVTVTGNPATGLQLFSDPGCTALLSGGAFNLAAGTSTGTFYAKSTRAGTPQLTAAATALNSAQQTFTVTPLAATALNLVGSGQGIATATCSSAVTVQTEDLYGNASPVSAATVVGLTSAPTGGGFLFYSDAGCTSAVTQVTIAAGAASEQFYFKGATAGTYTVTASSSVGNDTQPEVIGVGPPVKLVITTAPQNAVVAGTCSGIFTVQSRDVSDNPSNITGSALAVALATNPSTTGLQFFSDATCATPITGTSIAVGATTASVYFKSTTAGAVTILVSSSLPTGDSQTETIVPTTATVLRFTNNPFSVVANTCAGPFRVETRDQYGNVSNVFSNTQVNLTSTPPGVTFFTAAGCGTSTTQVTIAANSASATFYARATVADAYSVAAAGGVGSDSQTFTVTPADVDRLVFQPLASTVVAGACSGAVGVQRRDAFGNPVTAGGPATVTLGHAASGGTFSFHAVAGCTDGPVTTVDIPLNGSSATLYMKATKAEPVDVTGTSPGIPTGGTHTLTVTPDAVDRLVATPASQTVTAGVCGAQAVTVERRDQFDNPISTGSHTVNLTSSAVLGVTSFYAGSGCGGGTVGSIAIGPGSSSATFSVRTTRVEPVTVTAQANGIANDGSHALTVSAAAADRLVATPASQTVTAGACGAQAVTVERRDQFGNLVTAGNHTVNLTSSAVLGVTSFYDGGGCSGGTVGSIAINAGSSSATFSVKTTRVEPVSVTAQATGIPNNGSHALTVNPDVPNTVVFLNAQVTVEQGACGGPLTIELRDQYGNVSPSAAGTSVALTDNGTGFDFHLVAGCGDSATGSVAIAPGASTATFYVKSSTAGTVDVTATAAGVPNPGTQPVTVTPAANKLVFINPQRTIFAGECTLVLTVERQTAAGAAVTSGGPLVLTLSSPDATTNATGGLTFHTDAACNTAAITSAQIDGGQSSVSFYAKANVAESPTLRAAGGSLTPGTQTLVVNLGPPSKLVFTAPASPQSFAALSCSPAQSTVTLQDLGGNVVTTAAPRVVTFSALPGGANTTFYSDASCTTALVASQVTMLTGSSTVQMYFKAENPAAPLTLSAATPSITTGTTTATITAAPATKLVFTTSPPTVEAGFCVALTLERQDAISRPVTTASPTSVTALTATPAPALPAEALPMEFFSDGACLTPLGSPFPIPGGSANTVVYARARSGRVTGANSTGAQVYGVTAQASGLADGTVNVTVDPMVRRGTCSLAANTGSILCAVAPNLTDVSRTFLVYQAAPGSADNAPGDDNVTCHLQLNGTSGNAEVLCERASPTGNAALPINWQTVSFPYSYAQGGVTVQHLSSGCTAQPLDVGIPTTVPRNNSFVLFSSRGTGGVGGNNADDFFTAEMINNSTVQLLQPANGGATCSVPANFRIQVVTMAGASVARAVTAGGAGAQVTASQATPNPGRSFLLHSARMADIGTNSNEIGRYRFQGTINAVASTLVFDRSLTGSNVGDVSWERVELPASASVQPFTISDASGGGSTGNVTITAVDRTRAVVLLSGQGSGGQAGGRSTYTGNDQIGATHLGLVFNSATRFDWTRGANNGDGNWTAYVLQMVP